MRAGEVATKISRELGVELEIDVVLSEATYGSLVQTVAALAADARTERPESTSGSRSDSVRS